MRRGLRRSRLVTLRAHSTAIAPCVQHRRSRVFSGIQPTGAAPHIGNYLGALRNWAYLQDGRERSDVVYSIVDLHSLTAARAGAHVRQNSRSMAAALMACGVSPDRSIIYVQSDVPAHAELCWVLSCLTPIGHLQRMTQFKQKSGKDKSKANLGIFSYPVLQAADILLYRATDVPVGDDQQQHIELSRVLAENFNRFVGQPNCLVPPQAWVTPQSAVAQRVCSLRDGSKKMSKSDLSEYSRIDLTDSADTIALKIRRAKTDSEPGVSFDREKRPEVSNLIGIYAAMREVGTDEACGELAGLTLVGLKEAVTDELVSRICPIGDEIRHLMADPAGIDQVLRRGAEDAAEIAAVTMRTVREAMRID